MKMNTNEDKPDYPNIKHFHHKMTIYKSEYQQGHQGLEGKILGVFDFKNRNRISITDCLKEFDKSDSHYETLTKLKKRGKQQGQKLFRLGVRWMLYMSEAGYDFVQKMKVVADSLEWLCDGENAVVIDKFVHLLQTADTQLILDSNIDVQLLGEDDTDEEMLWLMKEILGLELLWMHRGLWNSKMSLAKDALPSLLSDMTDLECEIGKEPLTEGSDEFKAMLPKIDELWTQIGEVDKKERKVIDFQKLKKLLDDSIYQTNIKELYQKFNSAHTKGIHGFEHKIHALLHNGDNDCKNDQERERMKITFLECSDVEYNPFEESLENLESRAIEHGHNLFNVAIDLMFLMPSKSRIDKLQVVMKSLAWICEGEEDFVVMERFIELVKTLLATRMHKFNKKVSKRQKEAAMRSENKVEEEEVILSEEEEDESVIALMRAIIRLEIVLRAMDEADMVKCEVLLATLMRKVKRFGKESRLKAIKRTAEYKALLSKKMELWGVQISEKLN